MIALQIGYEYERGDGARVTILGYAQPNGRHTRHVLWSLQGDWYCAYSGRFVHYHEHSGGSYCSLQPGWRDVKKALDSPRNDLQTPS